MDHNIGKKLDGRYEISELIGIGGMADVYKATDIMEDKVVAVKILKNEFAGNDEFLRRFRNESKAIAVLSHPNIVKIYDVGFTEKIQYIVMEYIDGITLKEFIEQQHILKWKDAVHFSIQILRALQHAHDRGIVHRDIKPQNIMLFQDGTIKVMDFGIARFAREDGKTLSDKTIGSVHYISPEQARGDITDEKSDIYSVGAMLYEMLTGQKPFEADTPVAVALMHMQEVVKSPRDIVSSIPEGFEEIVMHAMQKDATKRYQSASEMIKDIEIFKQNPTIVFGYKNLASLNNEGATIYFNPIAKKNSDITNIDELEDDDDEDDEESKSSVIVAVLSGVAIAVVILAAFLISIMILKGMGGDTVQVKMPNLIGQKFNDVKNQVEDFKIEMDPFSDYSDEYEEGVIYEQEKIEGREIKQGETIKVKVSKGIRLIDVPSVKNTNFDSAKATLELKGFKVTRKNAFDNDITKDYVIRTDPEEYSQLPYGSEIAVHVSQGPTSQESKVPDVLGKTEAEAKKIIQEAHLITMVTPVDSLDPAGTVISQLPQKGETAVRDSSVTIFVSTGKIESVSRNIDLPIPSNASGSFIIDAWISGNKVATQTLERAEMTPKFPFVISGSGTQNVTFEVTSTATNKPVKYVEYIVDFPNSKIMDTVFTDADAFVKSAYVETTTVTTTTTPATTSTSVTSSSTTAVTTTNPLETSAGQ